MSDYDYDDDYYDDFGDDYDAYAHMTEDPVDFYTNGYGGFGYDTSHVPRDEAKSEIHVQAERGNLDAVRRIVEGAVSASDEERRRAVNRARRWTEVDYRMSGFTKEHAWFDVTPVAAAASRGHHEVVQYLLEQGADPTLSGCPCDDVYWDALEAAKHSLAGGKSPASAFVAAGPRRCVNLVELANLFWDKASYAGPHYSSSGRKALDNRPKGGRGLTLALKEVPSIHYYRNSSLDLEALERLKGKYWEEEAEEKEEQSKPPKPQKKNSSFGSFDGKRNAHTQRSSNAREPRPSPSAFGGKSNTKQTKDKAPSSREANTNSTASAGTAFKLSLGADVAPFHIGVTNTNNQNGKGGPSSKPMAFAFGGTGAANAANQTAASKPAFQFGKSKKRGTTPAADAPLFGSSPRSNICSGDNAAPTSKPFQFGETGRFAPTPVASAEPFGLGSPSKPRESVGRPPDPPAASKAFLFGEPTKPPPTSSFKFMPKTWQTTHASSPKHAGQCNPKTNSHDDASIEGALSILESVPAASLTRYLYRLQKLTHATHELGGAPTCKAVFSDCNLLGHILGFEGSLAYFHKNYDMIVGYENPLPYDWSDKYSDIPGARGTPLCDGLKYRPGSRSHLLVCKKWKDFVVGDAGLALWKSDSERMVAKKISLAKEVAQDTSQSWTARICACAIANDTASLKSAFARPKDKSTGIGAALVEQMDEDFEPLGSGHPFYRYCLVKIVDEDYDDDGMYSFTSSIAYAAALVGSTGALQVIETLGDDLWHISFDQKGDGLVNSLVRVACRNPTLDCIVDSIAFILSSYDQKRGSSYMHQRHRGGNGNHLHLAAARGHASLVGALIKGGMQPNRPCERIEKGRYDGYGEYRSYDDDSYDDYDSFDSDRSEHQYGDARDKGVKDNPLPVHWAAIRDHEDIVYLIRSMNGYDDRAKERGRVKAFNDSRGFGFIKRERGGKDIFVHISNIDDGEPLEEGEYVEFVTGQTSRGLQALEVERVEDNSWY